MATKSVISADGGAIFYYQVGRGPGLIILHGILQTWRSHRDLAEYLSPMFTVYLIERRGRGASASTGPGYGMQTEVQDVEALATAVQAPYLFGVSSGGIIALQAGLKLPGLFSKIALWEPPVVMDPDLRDTLLERVRGDIGRGDTTSALLTNMFMTDSAPAYAHWVPRWVLRRLVGFFISLEWKDGFRPQDTDKPLTLHDLGPTMVNDLSLLQQMDGPVERFAAVAENGSEVLILGGTATVEFFADSCEQLHEAVPGSTFTKIEGLTHLGASNHGVSGNPMLVSKELVRFFRRGIIKKYLPVHT